MAALPLSPPSRADFRAAQRVLELNAQSAPYAALKSALDGGDRDKAAKYVQILYHQALLIAGLPIDDAAEYTDLVCSLMD